MKRAEPSEEVRPAKRSRASRAGKPHTFICEHPGCGKSYSRAEHRARHALNHVPKKVFNCNLADCSQTFVREDLYLRHKNRHQLELQAASILGTNEPAVIRPDKSSKSPPSTAKGAPFAPTISTDVAPEAGPSTTIQTDELDDSDEDDSSISDTLESTPLQSVTIPGPFVPTGIVQQHPPAALEQPEWLSSAFADTTEPHVPGADNFASWLFDTPGSQDLGFTLPFFDSGLDWTPYDLSDPLVSLSTGAGIATLQDYYLDSGPEPPQPCPDHTYISPPTRETLVYLVQRFRERQRPRDGFRSFEQQVNSDLVLGELPNLNDNTFQECIAAYWEHVTVQLPVIHQPTFTSKACSPLLLLAMITLGAIHIVLTRPKRTAEPYKRLANVIATGLRWEIFEDVDAQPPVKLWVAQALLLLEFYEKMYATRALHERAHIGHSYALNLLRRGSPLVADSGSDTPQEGPTEPSSPTHAGRPTEPNDWWHRWARNESMRRVVFMAFRMDIFHAVMFGHNADLAPYEIRLPLPCDDSMWTADSGEEVQRLQEILAFHGLRTPHFLDALKLSLHGAEVHTHSLGRTILFAGLLSIGWHISRREKSLQFLDTPRSLQDQNRWRLMISQAFEVWRSSFHEVLSKSNHRWTERTGVDDPNLLFNFASVVMHVDIVEVQILAQSRRLLSRKVSSKDHTLVVQRMRAWASTSTGRLSVHHAFKVLYNTIVEKAPLRTSSLRANPGLMYSCRDDFIVHWPWMMYLSSLIIWAYEYSTFNQPVAHIPGSEHMTSNAHLAVAYLSASKQLSTPDGVHLLRSPRGCCALLDALADDYANAESDMFVEASARMRHCARMLERCPRAPT